ncbi:hypothetical protein [Roseibium sp.]
MRARWPCATRRFCRGRFSKVGAQARMNLGAQDSRPTSKQVAFVERLARIKRRAVPDECFRDKGLMWKWIDGNK